jgi:hypothetical protein
MALNEEILDNHINSKVKVFVDMRGWLIKGSGFLSRNELCDYEVLGEEFSIEFPLWLVCYIDESTHGIEIHIDIDLN